METTQRTVIFQKKNFVQWKIKRQCPEHGYRVGAKGNRRR